MSDIVHRLETQTVMGNPATVRALLDEAAAVIRCLRSGGPGPGWNPPGGEPLDGSTIEVQTNAIMKWAFYAKTSTQRRAGILGRWMRLNPHGRWDPCDPPERPWRATP